MFGLTRRREGRRRGGWAAAMAATAVMAAGLVPAQSALADTGSASSTAPAVTKTVTIDTTTTSGFVHPGVGVDAASLTTTPPQG